MDAFKSISLLKVEYATLDMRAEAERSFQARKLHHRSGKAWQTYVEAQLEDIWKMGGLSERSWTDVGLWRIFLANISSVPDVQSAVFEAYMRDKAKYDALPVQAKITKLLPVVRMWCIMPSRLL